MSKLGKFVLACLALAGTVSASRAAEISFLCANALQSTMEQLVPEFQKSTGHTVKITYASLGIITDRIQKGDQADLATVSPQQWQALHNASKIDPAVRIVFGRVGLGGFVKKGTARPDFSSVEAFKRALLSAHSIAVGDPNQGSPVGAYMVPLFDKLGVTADIKSKLQLTPGGPGVMQAVIKGSAELGFNQMSEIAASPDVDLVAPLPAEIQNFTSYVAALPLNAEQSTLAKAFADFLSSSKAISVFKAKGIDVEQTASR